MEYLVRTTVAKNPTPSDASNTAVRFLLRKAGSMTLPSMYDTTRGWGKEAWKDIVTNTFRGECAYCGAVGQKLEVEHLMITNRSQVGIHHPGNTVPCCKSCNRRKRIPGSQTEFDSWEVHLKKICEGAGEGSKFQERYDRIAKHMNEGEYKLPLNNEAALEAVRFITEDLYKEISHNCKRAVEKYENLLERFGGK